MSNCYEKFIAGMARSYKNVASFHCFRVSRRDVSNWFENEAFSIIRNPSFLIPNCLSRFPGVPMGREKLL